MIYFSHFGALMHEFRKTFTGHIYVHFLYINNKCKTYANTEEEYFSHCFAYKKNIPTHTHPSKSYYLTYNSLPITKITHSLYFKLCVTYSLYPDKVKTIFL